VAATTDTADRFSDPRDCAPGYSCFWDGTGGAGMGNGGCVPGNYNAIRAGDATGQVGQACTTEEDCVSPFGAGQCRDFGAGDHCTIFDCGAPGAIGRAVSEDVPVAIPIHIHALGLVGGEAPVRRRACI
jgi:hypothetical protein